MRTIILAAALALSACGPALQTGTPASAGSTSTGDKIMVGALQSLTLAELAYQTANAAATVAVDRGVLKGANATKARELNRTITAALVAAHGASNAAEMAVQVAKANNAIAGLSALAPSK